VARIAAHLAGAPLAVAIVVLRPYEAVGMEARVCSSATDARLEENEAGNAIGPGFGAGKIMTFF
jgi:hypothetical protein